MDKADIYQNGEEYHPHHHVCIRTLENERQEQAKLDVENQKKQSHDKELALRGHLVPSFSVESALKSWHDFDIHAYICIYIGIKVLKKGCK